ncbi:zygote arrest protein 1 isoform X2 [Rhineura floridana]|uniref:zygote arrest protein 1 isoform X2 n=1 Tax=Rhineura floridana TaxID=261503 RepID=UPI002AC86FDF|nr:zygote arrest protein 1 isoform X2 [Rhineura floridana]
MATLVEDAMESYVYPSYNPYSYRYQPPKGKGGPGPWRQRGGYFSGYGETAAVAAAAAEYFDNYQRAQLKAILSQVNPNLTPRLRKANTKEVGVQVNPRQDVSVQCSLGPRPLLLRRRTANVEQEQGSPVTGSSRPVRFPRTIAVYSPVASRRLTTFLEEPEPQTLTASPRPPPASSQPPEVDEGAVGAVGASWKNPEESPAEAQERRQPQKEEAAEGKEASQGGEERPAKSREATEKEEALPEEKREAEGELQAAEKPASQQQARKEAGQSKTRVRFQFLEQKYGYYHCKDCNIRWESAYVWCVQGTNKVYFRQFCRTCQKSYNPYRVEDITCQSCKQTRCTCPVKLRHVDPKRPHRQDLCGRCKGKRLSCDSTFSFKYII